MNKKKAKSDIKVQQQPRRISKLDIMIERAKKNNQEFLKSVHQLQVIEEKSQIIEEVKNPEKIEEESNNIQEEKYVSAKWLLTLKSTLQNEIEIMYQQEKEIDQIIKFQMKERINKQKVGNNWLYRLQEQQKKQYFNLINGLHLDEKHKIFDEQVKEDFQCTYQYQSLGKTVSLDIKYFDFMKLNISNCVNDTIINFMLRFIENEIVKQPNLLIFNTYFSAKLLQYSNDPKQLYTTYLSNHNQLTKWNKEDIFSKRFLLFPLHLKEHWAVLFVVNPKILCEEMLNQKKEQTNNKKGLLLYFDSLLLFDQRIGLQIKFFLLHQYNAVYKILNNEQIFQLAQQQIPLYQPIVPKQTNLVDCGLYMLEYCERFLLNPDLILNNLDKDHLQWFPKVIIFIKRVLIKKILFNLSQGAKDVVDRYIANCKQIDLNYSKPDQYDTIDEALLESLQIGRLQFYLGEEYNYYYDDD